MTTAVVFAYHNVGVRCLSVLLSNRIDVRLVVTHDDSPAENIWFESVRALADRAGIATTAPDDPNDETLVARLHAVRPDFLFSFYYRHMLPARVLSAATRGCFNMHGSLLPRYRGRVPVNWALVNGERETGATLHEMVDKPDAGRIVDQQAVPILANDRAIEVFNKTTVAAEMVLARSLPGLVDGTARLTEQNLRAGSYFGGRKPEDGRIDGAKDAWTIHNLVRAVAPPYPGAFATVNGKRLEILRTWWRGAGASTATADRPATPDLAGAPSPAADRPRTTTLYSEGGRIMLSAAGGGRVEVIEARFDGLPLTARNFPALTGTTRISIE